MKRIIAVITLIFILSTQNVMADARYHTFMGNPVNRNGIQQIRTGHQIVRTPYDIQCRMYGASGESSIKLLPAGIEVEAYQQGQMIIATRVKRCANKLEGCMWPIGNIQQEKIEQQQKQKIEVNVNFNAPEVPPDFTINGVAFTPGATYSQPYFQKMGNFSYTTKVWDKYIINSGNKISNTAHGGSANSSAHGGNHFQYQNQTTDVNVETNVFQGTQIDIDNGNVNQNNN